MFIKFGIAEFYPSISENTLETAIRFAEDHVEITDEEKRTIFHCVNPCFSTKMNLGRKKIVSCFDVTMGRYDGGKIYEFIGIYLLSQQCTIISKNDFGLYRDDGLIIQEHINGQQIDHLLKETGLEIDIETNLKTVNFLDMTFNLMNGSYNPPKKPNDTLLYINKNSDHPPNTTKKFSKAINDILCRNSSNAEIFHASKIEYETVLKNSGYKNIDFKYDLVYKNNNKQNRERNIIWFNPPFIQPVSINVPKQFLDLLDKYFPQNNQLHKVSNKNTVKASYSCTPNMGSIIKSHNKNLINAENE